MAKGLWVDGRENECCWLLVVGCWLLVGLADALVKCWLVGVRCSLFVACCSLLVACWLFFVVGSGGSPAGGFCVLRFWETSMAACLRIHVFP